MTIFCTTELSKQFHCSYSIVIQFYFISFRLNVTTKNSILFKSRNIAIKINNSQLFLNVIVIIPSLVMNYKLC